MSRLRQPKPRAVPTSVRSVNYSTSPLLASRTPPWRSKFLVALVGLSFLVLLGRAVYVQIVDAPFFLKQGESRYAHTLTLPASRGRIFDRNGLILAASIPAPSIWAIPKDIDADDGARAALAKLVGMTPRELDDRLAGSQNFVWLKRQVDDGVAQQIKALGIKGVHQIREYKRSYPESESAAHIVGFTDIENRGQEGVELAFQNNLAGRDGSRRVIRDRLGRVIEDLGDSVAPVDGHDIALTVDSKVQFFAYQRIRDAVTANKAKGGSVVVIDSQTGDVLALANYPSYMPNDRRNLSGAQLRNRALTDTFEPGSTMKPFVAGWALETRRVTPDTVIQTAPGRMTLTGSTITDSHAHGNLTVAQVIQKSSNVGAVRMAMTFSPREMWELYSAIGFGQKPQIGFPGAVTGRLRPYKSWRPIEQATMSYGYGLSASLFQIAHAYTVFAHDGEMIPVSLTRPVGSAPPPMATGLRVLSPKTARQIREMLHLVTLPGGTAPKAQVMGYAVGGKSGTAYKQEGKGYATKKYRAWFVGIAPIFNPRIIVAVMLDEPSNGRYYGGDVAAPVFSEVVQQTLRMMGVQPDMDVQPQIVSKDMPAEVESF
ncbi:peptidoglycan D,D-transpeptidase FtsI family protein [Piscinibacter koreensis]|uniref:Peptidoglycan D,D-transpeptidase FtsI n=1 Tax=Piscinibacter koreensis TaxID=2742824 RepID=A0A7Y6NTK2_9BURK|nr:penicillin-binding protein 2 [Schlegelella koreensis]NUZ08932.1 penicillin-binding protein 2 [Schlegelella koreensis]